MSFQTITAPEFIKVRQHIANLLKGGSTTQEPTRIRHAENLLSAGVIDLRAVLDHLAPELPPVGLDEISDLDENSYNGPDL